MRKLALVLVSCLLASGCAAQQSLQQEAAPIEPAAIFNVWPGVAPGAEGWTQQEVVGELPGGAFPNPIVRNVTTPTLTAYLPAPERATGAAVVIAPGGGFLFLSIKSEGTDVAQWLAARGVAAFVLKYRTRETPADEAGFTAVLMDLLRRVSQPASTQTQPARGFSDIAQYSVADAVRALELVRTRAGEWGIDPRRVGMMGFSAGARVTVGALLQDNPAARPNFAAPIYGGLFGESADFPSDLPPVFIAVSADDALALRSSLDLMSALREAGVRQEFHMFDGGGHGYGLNQQGASSDHWIDSFYWWMEANGLLNPR